MKVGDYVRTKDGIITKIIDSRKNPYGEETIFKLDKEISIDDLELSDMYLMTNPLAEDTTNEIDTHFGDEKIIIKSSPNIIDLIQVGDALSVKEYCDEACQMFTQIYLIQSDEQLLNIKEDLLENKNHKLYQIATKEQLKVWDELIWKSKH